MKTDSEKKVLYEEKQYLGTGKQSLALRLFLAIFCFAAYYFTDIPEVNGDLLFLLGVVIIIISVIMLFITHMHIRIFRDEILITGLLNTNPVRIPVVDNMNPVKVPYSKYLINNQVYNLHRNGVIKFYTSGKYAVSFSSGDGMHYLVGTQHPEQLIASLSPN